MHELHLWHQRPTPRPSFAVSAAGSALSSDFGDIERMHHAFWSDSRSLMPDWGATLIVSGNVIGAPELGGLVLVFW